MDAKLEALTLPVSDVDCAKAFNGCFLQEVFTKGPGR